MKVVTEGRLRALFRDRQGNPPMDRFVLKAGQILTPSARAFLSERRIPVQAAEDLPDTASCPNVPEAPDSGREGASSPAGRYVSALDGGRFEDKPEFMTHLKGNKLVAKDHGRILFRGRLDSFQSAILMVQASALERGQKQMVRDLEEVLGWVREMVRCEVLDIPLETASVLGLTPGQLREHSHNPKKAYGVDHITPAAEMGLALVSLNFLRSLVREVETAGVAAFRREFEVLRPDILTALNRMSSALYIMMARERAGMYPGKPGGVGPADSGPIHKE